MNVSRWMAPVFAGLFAVAFLCLPLETDEAGGAGRDGGGLTKGLGLILLCLGFICVWWSEALGDALFVGRGAWNPKASSGTAIAILGWLFLVSALLLCVAGDDFLTKMMGVPR